MLAKQLLQNTLPNIQLTDTAALALQLMEDYEVLHLPVTHNNAYVGIISKDALLDIDENNSIATLENQLLSQSIKPEEYFTAIIKFLVNHQVSLAPVVTNQQELLGVVDTTTLINFLHTFLHCNEPGAVIVLETDKRHFSFGEICRLIETNDAYITQLNTYTENETGLVIVSIKINKPEVSDIVATLQRYDYAVRYYFGEEEYTNQLKDNYNQLMFYLNM